MPPEPTNAQIADRLASLAALLDLQETSPFAARAYQRAAETIRGLPVQASTLVRSGRIRELRGIGPGIEARLVELVETGELREVAELEQELRPELVGLGRLLGLGTRTMLDIGRALGITTVDELRVAAAEGRLRSVPGIGAVKESHIVAALAAPMRPRRGLTLDRARALTDMVAQGTGGHAAGDPRRFCELSFELAVVCGTRVPSETLAAFEGHPLIVAVTERAEDHAVGVTVEGAAVRLVACPPERLGTELVRATGSAEYVESLEPLPDAPTEEEVFARLGIARRPPELRELPQRPIPASLVDVADLRGDLHCHSTWSDGRASIEEMATFARDLGYDYLAICDHTASVRVVPGLGPDDVRRQGEEIAQTGERLAPFRILHGIECDVLPDGGLDLPDEVLSTLDWVQLSLHAGQRRPREELTRIVTDAMRNPHVRGLSHPKGRILDRRPENALDLDEVFEVALAYDVALEINGLPDRLDLSSTHAAEALAAGVDLVLSSDAHSTRGLENVSLAVGTARRAACPAERVVNTRSLDELVRT